VFSVIIFLVILFGNAWIWRIFKLEPQVFLLTIVLSLVFFFKINYHRLKYKKSLLFIFVLISFLVFYLQIENTHFHSLTLLSNDQQRIHDTRIQYYQPSDHYIRLVFYKLKLIDFYEGKFMTIVNRLQRNFFESLDPNIYFYGGFPRQRVEILDFEKFPYILILPFFLGIYYLVNKKKWLFVSYFLLALAFLTFYGNDSFLGPFLIFPFFVMSIFIGIIQLVNLKQKLSNKFFNIAAVLFIFLFLISLTQNLIYAL
jgi:hypothetical protein